MILHMFNQIWNSKTYGKNKLVRGKKIVIPVAQIRNFKSDNSGYRDIQKVRKGKKIIIAIPKPKKKSISRHLKDSISHPGLLLVGRRSNSAKNISATDEKLKIRKSNKEKNRNSVELGEDDDDHMIHQNVKNVIRSKSKTKKPDVQVPLCPFDSLIFLGDLNYRMELPRLEVRVDLELYL